MIPEGWELYKFLELKDHTSTPKKKIKNMDFKIQGAFPIVDQSKTFIAGYCDNSENVNRFDIPVIIFGDHTRVFKYIDFDFAIGADGVQIIKPKIEIVDPKYLYYVLCNLRVRNDGYSRHFKQLKEANILISVDRSEQKRIAEILTSVDDAIQATEKVIEQTKRVKQGLLQELLTRGIGHTKFKKTQIGEIPESWEVRLFGDIVSSIEGGVSVNGEDRLANSTEKGVLKVSAVTSGSFVPDEHKSIVPKDMARARLNPKAGTIIFSRANTAPLVGASAYIEKDFQNLFLPDKLWQITTGKDTDTRWLGYLLKYLKDNGTLASHASGTSASMKNISKAKLTKIVIPFPPVDEQKAIASNIHSFDLAEKKQLDSLSYLKTVKSGLMQDLLTGRVRTIRGAA